MRPGSKRRVLETRHRVSLWVIRRASRCISSLSLSSYFPPSLLSALSFYKHLWLLVCRRFFLHIRYKQDGVHSFPAPKLLRDSDPCEFIAMSVIYLNCLLAKRPHLPGQGGMSMTHCCTTYKSYEVEAGANKSFDHQVSVSPGHG